MTDDPRGCPYGDLPDTSFWRRAVATRPAREVDPIVQVKFGISPTDKVATAGSCFAQHIARYLSRSSFGYFVAEPGHPILPEAIACLAGLNRMPFRTYFFALLCGGVPTSFVFAAIGALGQTEPVWALALSVIMPAVLWLLARRWLRR